MGDGAHVVVVLVREEVGEHGGGVARWCSVSVPMQQPPGDAAAWWMVLLDEAEAAMLVLRGGHGAREEAQRDGGEEGASPGMARSSPRRWGDRARPWLVVGRR